MKKKIVIKIEPKLDFRWAPDPHRRHGIVPNKKRYNRKAQTRSEPSLFVA